MAGANTQAATRVDGEPHPMRDGRVWSVAKQSYVMPGQTPGAAPPPKPQGPSFAAVKTYDQSPPVSTASTFPTAVKQYGATPGAGMGPGGKTYDTGNPGAGGIPGKGVAPPPPPPKTNPFRPGSLQADRWDQDNKMGIYAPGSTQKQYESTPLPPPSTTQIEGAMNSDVMDALQKPGTTSTTTANRKDGDPGPTAGTVWSSKDNAYIVPAPPGQTTTDPVTPVTPTPPVNPPVNPPVGPTYNETPIPDQDPANPISNAAALPRAIGAEWSLPNFNSLRDNEIKIADDQAKRDLEKSLQNTRNTYGGIGVSGAKIGMENELNKDFAIANATRAANIRKGYTDLETGLREGRYNSELAAALDQNRLQVGTVQNERQMQQQSDQFRETIRQQELSRNEATNNYIIGLRHEVATGEARDNAENRRAILTAILPFIIGPPPATAEEKAMADLARTLAQKAGVDYTPDASGGDSGGGKWDEVQGLFGTFMQLYDKVFKK